MTLPMIASGRVSVLLPARDAAATLGAALESLARQTRPPDDVVVVDDGSTDATPSVLEAWRSKLRSLRVLRTSGVGIARALNLGLAAIDGETGWIARMDADDLSHAERLERQLEHAAAKRLALVGCEVTHGDGTDFPGMARHIAWANSWHEHEELETALWLDSPLPHPGWLVRRDVFERVGGYDEGPRVPEDYEWLHRFFARARHESDLRAGKPAGKALLDWTESPGRLTRTSDAYAEEAFHAVKARALAARLDRERPVHVFGLGPKSKAIIPLLEKSLGAAGARIAGLVDVHPRRIGESYRGLEVWALNRWRAEAARSRPFVLIGVGTPEARAECSRVCEAEGMVVGRDFLAV